MDKHQDQAGEPRGRAKAPIATAGGPGRLAAWGEALLVLLAAMGLIALVTWPWVAHLGSAVSLHWDVGLHAWKLNWNARHILEGGWLLPGYHANFYYPQAYALALDDLFWAPSYFAALVLGLSANPILTYNLTFLFFWALNGLAMFLLLRELGLGRQAAWLGGLAFGLSPYLVSYYLEFNGILCFGIPLVMWLLVRFIKRPGVWAGLFLALAFWAQAVSALYYTAILALSLPLVLAPLLRERSELLRSGRFWALGAGSLVALTGLCWLYLNPYILLHNELGLGRSLGEMSLHSCDALSYLRNCSAFVASTGLPWPGLHLDAVRPEVIVWPGLAVLALALVYAWGFRLGLWPGATRRSGLGPAWAWLPWVRIICLGLFLAWEVTANLTSARALGGALGNLVLNLAILGILGSSLLLSLLPRNLGLRRRFVAGLATAAFLCFFISLGPKISVGAHQALADNWLVQFLANLEVLHITRVLSRYGIMVLFAMVVVGSLAFDRLPVRRTWKWVIFAAALGLIVLEADVQQIRPYVNPPHYPDPALEKSLRNQEPCTVLVLPLGDRDLDSHYMLQVAGDRGQRYLINGWTGFGYEYGKNLGRLFSRGDWQQGCRELARLWPDPLIVVDRAGLERYVTQRHYQTSEQTLAQHARRLFADQYYAVFQLPRQAKPGPRYERWVRSDLLARAKAVHFSARSTGADAATPARLHVNDQVLARLDLEPHWRTYNLKLDRPDLSIPYNAIALQAEPGSTGLMAVKDFCLVFR